MEREDKELLLKDLCARLPYGVKVLMNDGAIEELQNVNVSTLICNGLRGLPQPYLFPLSSMTEEQKREYNRWKHEIPVCRYEYGDVVEEIELYDSPESFEYLIANHFDYRGLIPMGLAIDATGLNVY